MARTASSRRWLQEHFSDPYVKKSWQEGYRSRAAYKLLALQNKWAFLKPGMRVIDLGAAPGSWTQVVSQVVGAKGKVYALDLLPIAPLPEVSFIQGDFSDEACYEKLKTCLQGQKADVVLSDMAPNLSGQKNVDQMKIMALAEQVLVFTLEVLHPKGALVIKLFQGEGTDIFLKDLRRHFCSVKISKPEASRSRSAEIYAIALGVAVSCAN